MSEKQCNLQVVNSIKIAESLCADYPYFRSLVAVEHNHKDVNKRIWLFRRSEEFDKHFAELKAEAVRARKEKEDICESGN